jgi:hypothetical protein
LIVVPVDQMDFLKSKGLTEKDLVQVLNDGDVNFSESKKQGNPQVYSMEKEFEGKGKLKFYFSLPKESFISEIHFSEKSANAVHNTTDGLGEIIHFPKDNDLVFVDNQGLLKEIELKDTKQILKLIKSKGMIDFKKSNLKASPKPEHLIIFKDSKGRRMGARAVWYKNKIDISSIEVLN